MGSSLDLPIHLIHTAGADEITANLSRNDSSEKFRENNTSSQRMARTLVKKKLTGSSPNKRLSSQKLKA